MRVLLVHDDKVGDPIADVLMKFPIKEVESVALSDFLKRCGVEMSTTDCTATVGDLDGIYDRVIDRVVEVSPRTLEAFGGKGAGLQRGQVLAIYEQLLARTDPPDMGRQYSTLGKLLPLPTQWYLVNKSFPALRTPEFRYAYGPEIIDGQDMSSPIFKSPFDLYTWKPNERPDKQAWDDFIVSRPSGIPVLSYKLNDEVIIESLQPVSTLIPHTSLLRSATVEILQLFSARVGEILWYVTESDVTFAAFSHFLAGAAMSTEFSAQARVYLDSFLSEPIAQEVELA